MTKTPKTPKPPNQEDEKPRNGRPPHEPTKVMRETVKLHSLVGTPQEMIADLLKIDSRTLRKHYREELDHSAVIATAQVGGALFNKAVGGDTSAQIFWMKTRAGWREKSDVNVISEDGSMSPKASLDASKLSTEALRELINAKKKDDD